MKIDTNCDNISANCDNIGTNCNNIGINCDNISTSHHIYRKQVKSFRRKEWKVPSGNTQPTQTG